MQRVHLFRGILLPMVPVRKHHQRPRVYTKSRLCQIIGNYFGGNQLSERRKGDKGKVELARQLRAETTMTFAWIAGWLQMGGWSHVSNLLREKP